MSAVRLRSVWRRIPGALLTVALVAFGVLFLAPLVWLFVTVVTPSDQAFQVPPVWLPLPPTIENILDVPTYIPLGRMYLNSIIVSVAITAGSMLVSTLAAYAFSRIPFRGSRALLVVLLAALMVPAQLTIIPVFVAMSRLELVDTLAAVILPGLISVFQIFFFTQYFNTIPRELDEAARIDGAGHGWILFRMLIPLSGPAIAAMGVLTFEASWNSYFAPLIFLISPENMTLPIGMVRLQTSLGSTPPVVLFAAVAIAVLPTLLVFLFFQRAFIASIASSGIKG